jgi:hypothetical protein
MRQIAKAAGIPLGDAKCIPNVQLIVSTDKKALIEALQKRYPIYFGDLSGSAVRKLAREPGHAAAWHLNGAPLDADGVPVPGLVGAVPVKRTSRMPSRIDPATQAHFAAAVVVVESGALDGLTTTQLADYAAMRAFARIDASRIAEASAPTILKVLDAPMGSEVPITITDWDMAFLRAFYDSNGGLYAAGQRSDIRKRLRKELEKGESRAEP